MIDPLITHEHEQRILELLELVDEIDNSDIQGMVTVIVNDIMRAGQKLSNIK